MVRGPNRGSAAAQGHTLAQGASAGPQNLNGTAVSRESGVHAEHGAFGCSPTRSQAHRADAKGNLFVVNNLPKRQRRPQICLRVYDADSRPIGIALSM